MFNMVERMQLPLQVVKSFFPLELSFTSWPQVISVSLLTWKLSLLSDKVLKSRDILEPLAHACSTRHVFSKQYSYQQETHHASIDTAMPIFSPIFRPFHVHDVKARKLTAIFSKFYQKLEFVQAGLWMFCTQKGPCTISILLFENLKQPKILKCQK